MSISAISAVSSSSAYSSVASKSADQLQRQIQALLRQIDAEQQSKTDDAKTKAQKIQMLDTQILALQAQLAQA